MTKYGIFEKRSIRDVIWNIGNITAGKNRAYYFYAQREPEKQVALSKKEVLMLLDKNEQLKGLVLSKTINMSTHGKFYIDLTNMDSVKKIVTYLNEND
ncbi:hypothetical protein LNP18_08400 [Leuconostoc citreum]|uniref:hypothetical protein n=1 Tax=Leuconostoc citreum TaxID=33964 RepID=UPI00200ADC83|nr:hypothetical protein [Leuconostoc citreum]MCK8606122.1 hypothetical protein [Leuconostoc citreum]